MTYRVIVTGCRDWADQNELSCVLGGILIKRRSLAIKERRSVDLKIVHGACYPKPLPDGSRPLISADYLAERWARDCDVPSEENFANWKLGKVAGPIRNREMAAKGASLCVAFWDGNSTGTLDMIKQAVAHGIPVRIVPKVTPRGREAL